MTLPGESLYFFLQAPDPFIDPSATHLDDGLTGPPTTNSAGKPRETSLLFRQPRQQVLEPGQLNLEPPIAAASPLGEDVEDQLGPIDDLHARLIFESATLGGLHVHIENGHVSLPSHALEDDLSNLATAHNRLRMQL